MAWPSSCMTCTCCRWCGRTMRCRSQFVHRIAADRPACEHSRLAAIRQLLPPRPAVRPCRVHGRCGLWPRRRDGGEVAVWPRCGRCCRHRHHSRPRVPPFALAAFRGVVAAVVPASRRGRLAAIRQGLPPSPTRRPRSPVPRSRTKVASRWPTDRRRDVGT